MPPIHLLNELSQLVPSQFEFKLLRSGIFEFGKGWTEKARTNGLLFDLSRVEWVEFGTLVQLVLLVESALIHEIKISVVLPDSERRYSEEEWIAKAPSDEAYIDGQVTRRRKVLKFLDYLGFTNALNAEHLGNLKSNLTILPCYDPSRPADKPRTKPTLSLDDEPKRLYEFFFPLTWLATGDDQKTVKISKFLSGIVGQRERGLEAIDADAISNVILYELVDNVAVHAGGSGHALIAAWARREGWIYDPSHYVDCEQPFVEWLSQLQSSSVEIVVGDSGAGVPTVLGKSFDASAAFAANRFKTRRVKASQILQWAFDRWSTSRKEKGLRGTRGLYRVDRVVSKYRGLVTLRAEDTMAGRDHGGASYDESVFAKKLLAAIPGTILRCRMPSFHEDLSPRIAAGRLPVDVRFDPIHLGVITPDGINEQTAQKLEDKLRRARVGRPLCVIALVQGANQPKIAVEATLRQCVETRHPGTLVVLGLPGGWALLEGAIESINAEHEEQSRGIESAKAKHFHVWDPVLVIGPQGQFGWVGVDKPAKSILNSLLASENGKITYHYLQLLLPEQKVRVATLKYFRSDTNLVRIHEDQQIEILVTGAEIAAFTISQLHAYLTEPGDREGILSGGVFRTPSLLPVKKWLNVETIVEKSCGYELSTFALSQFLKQSDAWKQIGPANTVLADSTVSTIHLTKFQEYLGSDLLKETIPGETGAPIPPSASILRHGARVIVYCDVIAASEAVGRCLRLIRREGAQAVAIACLIDARQDAGTKLRLLDIEVPVVSLTEMDIIAPDEPNARNISPITRGLEESSNRTLNYIVTKHQLKELIKENYALHFSHIGRPIGRHFTFYLNALPFFDNSVICDAFNEAIDTALETWRKAGIEPTDPKLELWHPSPEPKPSEPARRFAEMIKSARSDVGVVKTTRRESAYGQWVFTSVNESFVGNSTVVVVDWGALTGTTIMQGLRLAAEAGAQRVLACVFLSQLKPEEEMFLRSLKSLRVQSLAPQFDGTKQLSFETEAREIVTDVIVEFLAGYPVEAYSRYECPVCQQLDRLSQEEYPTDILRQFATDQKEIRLRLRTREQVLARDPQDFDDRPIPVDSVLWMLDFRGELVDALVSTARRKEISDKVISYLQLVKGSTSSNSEVLWLLQFLSIESQWLRRPPLYFRRLRDAISRIALLVALNSQIAESDRLNAIIVLRTSNKRLFAKNFSDLFKSGCNSEQIMKQLLYDAFTYVSRPYHQTEIVFQPLRDQLQIVRDGLASWIQVPPPIPEGIVETVERLLQKAEIRLVKAHYRSLTPFDAWSELNRILVIDYQAHRAAPEAMARMLSELNTYESQIQVLLNPNTEVARPTLSVPWLRRLQKNWSAPRDFVGNTLLELLARLRRILESDDGKTALGHDTVEQLIGMIDSKTSLAESDFSKLIKRMSEEPQAILDGSNWETLKTELEWYWENIFRPPAQNSAGSRLITFIKSAPSLLGATVDEVYKERKEILPPHKVDGLERLLLVEQSVFCPEGLLADLVGHVLDNLTKHWVPGNEQMRIRFTSKEGDGKVQLTVWNDATREEEKEKRGVGLALLRKRLRPFNGDLIVTFGNVNRWATGKVEMIFVKGE